LIILQKRNNSDLIAQVFKSPSLFMACGFGVGLIRPGPGTWGTLIALPIHYSLSSLMALEGLLVFWVLMFFFGIAVCRSAEKILGQSDTHQS
jgi:phosphatidylglycerophosphatase A